MRPSRPFTLSHTDSQSFFRTLTLKEKTQSSRLNKRVGELTSFFFSHLQHFVDAPAHTWQTTAPHPLQGFSFPVQLV
jgi:hypothetical protein